MALLTALVSAGERNADTIQRLTDPATKAGTLDWTKAQLAAHLSVGAEEYLTMAAGRSTLSTAVRDRAAVNAAIIERAAGTSLDELAEMLRAVTHQFAEFVAERGEQPVTWYEHQVPAPVIAGLFVADMLVHSYDLGGASIPDDEAAEALAVIAHVLPFMVKGGTRPNRATISLRPHGRDATVVVVDGDAVTVGAESKVIDAHVTGHASTLLLSAYGRLNTLQAMRRGMRVSGRRPWRARALQTRFETP